MQTTIVTTQRTYDGRSVRYHVDSPTEDVAADVAACLREGRLVMVPDLRNAGENYYINPEHVFVIHPRHEREQD